MMGADLWAGTPVAGSTAKALAALSRPARRYLDFMRVDASTVRRRSVEVYAHGSFRLHPRHGWTPCTVRQYDAVGPFRHALDLTMRWHGLLPLHARDTYENGRGRLQVDALGKLPVLNQSNPGLDVSELVTLLNDVVLLSPTMLLGPHVEWHAVDDEAFGLTLRDGAIAVSARIEVDPAGAVLRFSTEDRFGTDPHGAHAPARTHWETHTPVWTWRADHPVPVEGSATWSFASGDFEYARLSFGDARIAFDVDPD